MLPALANPLVVSTMTLLLASAVCRVVVLSVELAAVPVNVGPPLIEALAPVEIVMSLGSSRSVPVAPSGARVSTAPSKASVCLPDTSTKPPSPPRTPPRAEIVPANRVASSAQTMTLPPCPASRASALKVAAAPISVLRALRIAALAPW